MTLMEFILLAAIFCSVVGVALTGFVWARNRRLAEEQRLRGKPLSDPSLGSTPELILGDLTPALAGQVPMAADDRTQLQQDLRAAGFYRPTALMEYAAVRAVLIILPLIAAAVLALFAETGQAPWIWGVGIFLAVLGFSLPRLYVYLQGKKRQKEIERGLPVAIDMLTLCLSAGLNIVTSLQRTVAELFRSFPMLAQELEIVRRQSELRSFEFAVGQFAERTGLPNLRNLSVILTQSENLGTDTLSILREFADNLRISMRQQADAMSNRAPINLLFPTHMMIFGAAILLFGPVVLELRDFYRGNLVRESRESGMQQLQQLNVPMDKGTLAPGLSKGGALKKGAAKGGSSEP